MQDSTAESDGILVPGVDVPSSVSCLRSLSPRGAHTIVGAESASTPAASSTYCDEFVRLPDPGKSLSGYAEALLSIAESRSLRTILPVREEDVYALSRNRAAFAEHTATPWPTFETLRRVQDRVELFDAAANAGVETPETATMDAWNDWDAETIIKPRYTVAAPEFLGDEAGRGEIGSTVYREPGSAPSVTDFRERWGHVPLVQEYVSDPREYGFFALYDHGEAVATFQHCQRRGWEYCGGPSAYRVSVDDPALEAAGRAVLDELEWHGLAMVEFLRDPETGAFKLMEVNPRFWSSLPFTIQAGVDFPYYVWQLAGGEPVSYAGSYEVGIGGHLLRGEVRYLHSVLTETYPLVDRPSVPGAFRAVISSLVRDPRFDYASIDDPMPFVQDLRNTVRTTSESPSMPRLRRAPDPSR